MKARNMIAIIWAAALLFLISGCPKEPAPSGPLGPPPELVKELKAAEAAVETLAPLSPTAEDLALYNSLFEEARAALDSGNYELAFDKAKRARLEAEKVHGRLIYHELTKLNPSPTLTFHYRDLINKSEQAEKLGDLDQALALTEEARRQAGLALEFQTQCLESNQQTLDLVKKEIELLFRPDLRIVQTYWKAVKLNSENKCEETQTALKQLREMIDDFSRANLYPDRMFTVQASIEYVQRYGNPAMYEKVSDQGLVNQINWVKPGNKVKFVQSMLFSPTRTYYLVEDPLTNKIGWMAEERVWPERAQQMKPAGPNQ